MNDRAALGPQPCDIGAHHRLTVSTAGSGLSGSADGPGAQASFNDPFGVAVDPGGNVYVADTDNHTIRKIAQA